MFELALRQTVPQQLIGCELVLVDTCVTSTYLLIHYVGYVNRGGRPARQLQVKGKRDYDS